MPDDSYPEAWKPAHIRQRAVNDAVEQYIASLSNEEFDDLTARTRPAGAR